MGVEYRHFLVIDDAAWVPQKDTASRLDAVLRGEGLVSKKPEKFLLRGNEEQPLKSLPSGVPGPGVLLVYPEVVGKAVPTIVGPSLYDAKPSERYLQTISIVIGSDYRVHASSEVLYCNVKSGPTSATGRLVSPYPGDPPRRLYDSAYPGRGKTSAPVVKVQVSPGEKSHMGWRAFTGCWRVALILDCGKDLPAFIDKKYVLPNRTFVASVAQALRGRVVEVGKIY